MAYKVIILYQLYMPSYFLGTFTEYPQLFLKKIKKVLLSFTLFFLKSVSLYENKNVRLN